MKKCPACEKNIPAYKTVVGEVNLLCETHLDQLEGSLHNIIESHEPVARGADTSAKPNTESDKSIDEILEHFGERWIMEETGLTNRPKSDELQVAKNRLHSLLMDVIGTDEDETNTKDGITNVRVFSENRNQLRAEQRTKLKELFNEKEK